MDKKYQTRYSADTILRDGVQIKTAKDEAMKKLNLAAKLYQERNLSELDGVLESLIARLGELDIYRTIRYPEEKTPKIFYDYVLSQAKKLLPDHLYQVLDEYGKANWRNETTTP